jgi:MacB-like periplasmic core domain/FtsX-like permease family
MGFPLTYPDFVHLREGARSFSGLAGFSFSNTMNLTGSGKPERVSGAVASANYFDVLGVKPTLDRTFLPAEDQTPGGAPVAVISYRFWQTHFGGDTSILAAGRDITQQDTETSQPVAVVNQSFVDRYWRRQEPLGKRIVTDISDKTFVVVGVTRNTYFADPNGDPGPLLYLPLYQLYRSDMTVHVRVAGDPLASAAAVGESIHEINADLPLYNVTTLKSSIQLATIGTRIAGTFVGAFGLVALVLATVGIYGVISYATRQRTRELAIRLALGAEPQQIFRLVQSQGLWLALIGISIGLAVSMLLTRFLKNLLLGITATDALTFSAVAVLVALLACFMPAYRATQVDPMRALRYE